MARLRPALEIEVSLSFLAGLENASVPGTSVPDHNLIEPDGVIFKSEDSDRARNGLTTAWLPRWFGKVRWAIWPFIESTLLDSMQDTRRHPAVRSGYSSTVSSFREYLARN